MRREGGEQADKDDRAGISGLLSQLNLRLEYAPRCCREAPRCPDEAQASAQTVHLESVPGLIRRCESESRARRASSRSRIQVYVFFSLGSSIDFLQTGAP